MISMNLSDTDPEIAAEHAAELAQKGLTFMGAEVFDPASLWMLLLRFGFNLLVCWIIIRFFYYRKSRRRDYYFTFMLFGVTIFLLLYLLQNIPMQIGFALGLFAIFGMIRYRTETVQIREMTYLFVIIGISVINGLSMETPYATVVVTNLLFLLVIRLVESVRLPSQTSSKIVFYEKIELIKPENYDALIADLKLRTGLDILCLHLKRKDCIFSQERQKSDHNRN